MFKTKRFFLLLVLLCFFTALVSCNSDSSSDNVISGVVADDPVAGASVTVSGDNGEILGTCVSDESGTYTIAVPDAGKYRIKAEGGTMGGEPFDATMESMCEEAGDCHVTPLTTVAVRLADKYGWSWPKAGREARRALGLKSDGADPFVLAVTGEKNEDGTIEGLESANLEYVRGRIAEDGITFAEWISSTLESMKAPYAQPVSGSAEIESPLAGAEVRILVDDEEPFGTVTDSAGQWRSPENMNITGPFRIEVSGGESLLNAFDGTLSAYIPYREPGNSDEQNQTVMDTVRVDVMSTLIDRYMQQSGKSFEDACASVKRYLSIPEDVGLNDADTLPQYFSPYVFMELCSEKSGFDTYTEDLVTDVDSMDSVTIGGAANLRPYVTQATWGGKIVDGVMCGAVSAGLGFGLKAAESYLLPALGFETPDQALQRELGAIHSTLVSMDEKLAGIDIKTDKVLEKVEEVLAQDKLTKAQPCFTEANRNSILIQNAYDKMLDLKAYDERQADEVADEAYVDFLEDTKRADVKKQLEQIYSHLYEVDAGESGMEYLTQGLELKIKNAAPEDKSRVLWESYLYLEKNFSKMMGVQIEGILLYLNLYNLEKDKSIIEGEFIEDTDAWRLFTYHSNNPYNNIIKQTDLFQTYVERLVVASANTKTVIAGGYDMFPPVIEDVFYHADLLAQVFSPKHRAGFVYRVIGDPKIIHRYHYNNYMPDYFGGRATLFSIENKSRRDYTAPLPEDYPDYYLGWSFDSVKNYHFDKRTTIQVVKLYFKNIENELSAKSDAAFPFGRTYNLPYGRKAVVEFDRVNPTTGRRYTQEDAENGVVAKRYGHATVISRIIPKFTFEERDEITTREGRGVGTMDHGFDFESGTTHANSISYFEDDPESSYFWGKICSHINLSIGIVNDEDDDVSLNFHGAVRENVKNNKGGDSRIALKEELYWSVLADEKTVTSRHFDYENPYFGGISGTHENDVEGSTDAVWPDKQMRKIYFNTRNYVYFKRLGDWEEQLKVDFETKVLSLELK